MESLNFGSPNISINNFDKQIMEDGICSSNQRENGNLYSFPGILHYLQAEWNKMETERAHWDIEKAELMAKIAFLQGEKKGQESLKEDLVRRIKMLEYALKQKNQAICELRYGGGGKGGNERALVDITKGNTVGIGEEEAVRGSQLRLAMTDVDKAKLASSEWRESRLRLRQFLQEVGYVDTIVDARQIRLRNILSDGFFSKLMDDQGRSKHIDESLQDAENSVLKTFDFLGQPDNNLKGGDEIATAAAAAAVGSGSGSNVDDGNKLSEDESLWLSQLSSVAAAGGVGRIGNNRGGGSKVEKQLGIMMMMNSKGGGGGGKGFSKTDKFSRLSKKDSELQEFLAQLSDETAHGEETSSVNKAHHEEDGGNDRRTLISNNDMESYGNSFGLGDLASITVTNDADCDVSEISKNNFSAGNLDKNIIADNKVDSSSSITNTIDNSTNIVKKYWSVKYTLRGHFDSVRCLSFYDNESAVITGSDDGTIKVWNFNKAQLSKRAVNSEMEAVQTLRGHDGAVLCVRVLSIDFCSNITTSSDGNSVQLAVSGGLDGSLRLWTLPASLDTDPYELYDHSMENSLTIAAAHNGPLWSLDCKVDNKDSILMTASYDSIKLWSILAGDSLSTLSQDSTVYRGKNVTACLLKEMNIVGLLSGHSSPSASNVRITTAAFMKQDYNQLVVGTSFGHLIIIDIQTASIKLLVDMRKLETSDGVDFDGGSWSNQAILSVAVHPTLPLVFCGHQDHCLRTVDLTSGSVLHSMVVHQDSVSCVDIDSSGMFLITGSHDGSLRVWDMDKKSCVQEISSHRVKNNESVHAVSFHSRMAFIGSCGAEGIVKLYS